MEETGKECRFCFEGDPDLIAPCLCSGSSKYIHRKCLDRWRTTTIQPNAFTQCTTCHFEFKTTAQPTCITPETKYQLMIARDIASVIVILLGLIGLVGLMTYYSDRKAANIPLLFNEMGMDNTTGAYILASIVIFLAIVGFFAATTYCCVKCCADTSGSGGSNDIMCGYFCGDNCCVCCTDADACNCCSGGSGGCGDCGGCGGCGGCGDCKCDGGGDAGQAAIIMLLVAIIAFAVLGLFALIYFMSLFIAATYSRHRAILHNQAVASGQRVRDLDGMTVQEKQALPSTTGERTGVGGEDARLLIDTAPRPTAPLLVLEPPKYGDVKEV
eukprot:m.210162 g.210162  ORF g.210162 m.210162 type:complete len:328 (+) comp33065_c0_seq5:101-1084(+)